MVPGDDRELFERIVSASVRGSDHLHGPSEFHGSSAFRVHHTHTLVDDWPHEKKERLAKHIDELHAPIVVR